ncbi:MAG: xanthine dehydrogenase FAD-binding subunit XdhB [Termitinemataceae bacterium]|nr:MAG: xanthine dehydrogenase FAD-binding subunit XdhB [Termitinemataceae bacterium]
MFDIKAIYEAKSLIHASTLLREHPKAYIIAGGSDMLIKIRNGTLAGCELVDIHSLNEPRNICILDNGAIKIGALASFKSVSTNKILKSALPVLCDAAASAGGPQIRAMGTIGGNISNGVTSADTASTLLAFDAELEYTNAEGSRIVPISEHYISAGKTSLQHDEILSAIIIPKSSYEQCHGVYIKYAMREAMDIAILGCSVNIKLSKDSKTIERARIAFGVAGPVPVRAKETEMRLNGSRADESALEIAANAVLKDINARDSWRASRDFREHLAQELVRRCLRSAIEHCLNSKLAASA